MVNHKARHVKSKNSGSSSQAFQPNAPFFHDGGHKNNKVNNYHSKETTTKIDLCE